MGATGRKSAAAARNHNDAAVFRAGATRSSDNRQTGVPGRKSAAATGTHNDAAVFRSPHDPQKKTPAPQRPGVRMRRYARLAARRGYRLASENVRPLASGGAVLTAQAFPRKK